MRGLQTQYTDRKIDIENVSMMLNNKIRIVFIAKIIFL